MNNSIAVTEVSSEYILESLQDVDKIIVKITESIHDLRKAKKKLNLIENKTPSEQNELAQIEEALVRELKELDEKFELANNLVTQMQEHTFKMINNNDGITEHKVRHGCESSGEFHNLLVLHRENAKEIPPHVFVMESKPEICKISCSLNDDSELSCVRESSDENIINCPLENTCDTNNLRLQHDICELKEKIQNIVNENHELRFQLKASIQRNDVLAQSLDRPAPFKNSITGEIRFPGKHEMEEKLLMLKTEILSLHTEINEVQTNHSKLKTAKDFIVQYNSMIVNCQCGGPSFKDNINQNVRVKKEKIQHMELQIKQKNNEFNNMISNYETTVKINQQNIDELDKLIETVDDMVSYLKSIGEYKYGDEEDRQTALNTVAEDIEAMELVIKQRQDDLQDCNEKLHLVKQETKEIIDKTEKLETALNGLSKDFTTTYTNLESVYTEQLEEMMALPKIIRTTHIKLQEETDMRVLAEGTRDKLEYEIREAEAAKKDVLDDDEIGKQIQLLETEIQEHKTKLEGLNENTKSANADLNNDLIELDLLNRALDNAVAEGTKHMNAFKKFSTMHTERIGNDITKIQELLTQLQSKQCEKDIIKTTVVDNIKAKLDSINQTVEECKLEISVILCSESEEQLSS